MKKRFLTREVKVGLMVIAAVFVLFFTMNFLKGINIFRPTNTYHVTYDNIDGLISSSPVFLKGYKVGQVDKINYDFSKPTPFVVSISISNKIQLPKGSVVELTDDGLMGGKALKLILDQSAPIAGNIYNENDTLPSVVGGGLLTQLSKNLIPKIESLISQADSSLQSVQNLLEDERINNSLQSVENTAHNIEIASVQLNRLLQKDMPLIADNVNSITKDFKEISHELNQINFASTMNSIDSVVNNLQTMTEAINSPESTIGLLLNDKDLYMNLTNTVTNADKLLIDLKENPGRYVHFSLFGKKK